MFKSMKTTKNERFKLIREDLGLTQEELATVMDVSLSSVQKIEQGAPLSEKNEDKFMYVTMVDQAYWVNGVGGLRYQRDKEDVKTKVFNMLRTETYGAENKYKLAFEERESRVKFLEQEVQSLWQMISHLTGGKVNFLKPLNEAAIIPLNAKEAEVVALRGRAVANG